MKTICTFFICLFSIISVAQISEVELIADGIVFPRMNTSQRNALNPVQGQCIFNTQTKSLECYDGTFWTSATGGSGSSSSITDSDNDTTIDVELTNDEDIIRFKTNGTEVMRHDGQTLHIINSGQSVFIGENAGVADNLSGNKNTFIGSLSGQANVTGSQNVAVGHQALKDNIVGANNVAIGQQALQKNKNFNNIAIGFNAARDNDSGKKNIAIGGYSGFTNQDGIHNTFIGYEAGRNTSTNTSGSVMIGHQAGMNEQSDNRLYIDNSNTSTPLIYGDFSMNKVKVHGQVEATGTIMVGDDLSAPQTGMIRYNASNKDFEARKVTGWASITQSNPKYTLSGPVNNSSVDLPPNTWIQVGPSMTVSKTSISSVLEIEYNGRAYASTFPSSPGGIRFELRIDGQTANHTIPGSLRFVELEDMISAKTIFTSLSDGTYTIRMFAKSSANSGTATGVLLDNGGYGAKFICKEF